MRVALDHSGQQRRAGEFDYFGAGGSSYVRANGGDLVALDQHRPAFMGLRAQPVEHAGGMEKDRIG